MSRSIGLALLLIAFQTGCRSVWVHPEATKEKYETDLSSCKYGVKLGNSDSSGSTVATSGKVDRDWKHCMVSLGWGTTASLRSDAPGRRPLPPRQSGKR